MLTKCPLDVSFYTRTGTQQHTSAAFRQNSGVAGAYAPAFVERSVSSGRARAHSRCRRSLCSGLR